MATQSRSGASWERVLAAIEADAARAAALLVADDALAAAGIEYDGLGSAPAMTGGAEVPATWRLPTATAPTSAPSATPAASFAVHSPGRLGPATIGRDISTEVGGDPFDMPDATTMPPMTSEVRERLAHLQARIANLQSELAIAMAETQAILAKPAPRRVDAAPRPELVDRLA